jgi:hypothetical protein
MQPSSHSQPEAVSETSLRPREQARTQQRELVRQWLAEKGLDFDLALEVGAKYVEGGELRFRYEHPDGETAWRIFYPGPRPGEGGPRLWELGSRAKGALWLPKSEYATEPTTLLLTEGETDALAAVQSQCPWRVGCYPGASMPSEALVTFCQNLRIKRIVLAFDNDDAGNKGAAKAAGYAGDYPVLRLNLPPGGDLKDYLKGNQPRVLVADWNRLEATLEDYAPPEVPLARPERGAYARPSFKRPYLNTKPELLDVWRQLAPALPRRATRTDAQGRQIREAFCPFHDDGSTPGAWVGETRWGCWVCGIESADVYELIAWKHGIVTTGTQLEGRDFARAKELAEGYAGGSGV